MISQNSLRVGISTGDTNGIGLEVVLKALADRSLYADCTPIIYASTAVVEQHLAPLEIDPPIFTLARAGEELEQGRIYVKEIWEDNHQIELGKATIESGRLSYESLSAVVDDLVREEIDAMVTAPIDKKNIQNLSFRFPGHTEYLASASGSDEVLMLLMSGDLRVGVVTGHIPLSEVASALSGSLIASKARLIHRTLIQDLGMANPRIAILGLNPHAGDGGLIGPEEESLIIPAIASLQSEGIDAQGPFPADGFFGSAVYKAYDAILAMYHDQGLVPFKALSFGSGVNFTAGLSIVRTSPDHGTAFGIAGKNEADASSFAAAFLSAKEIVRNRRAQQDNGHLQESC